MKKRVGRIKEKITDIYIYINYRSWYVEVLSQEYNQRYEHKGKFLWVKIYYRNNFDTLKFYIWNKFK